MTGIALVGRGAMARAHASSLELLGRRDDIRLIYTPRGGAGIAEAPLARVVDDFSEVLNDPSIAVVSICSPTPTHRELAVAALERGKSVLLEKPIALTVPDALAIAEAAETSAGTLMIAHVLRFFDSYSALHELHAAGILGIAQSVRATRMGSPLGVAEWIADERQSGGTIVDLSIHDFDQVNVLLGTPVAVRSIRVGLDGPTETTVEYLEGGVGQVLGSRSLAPGIPFTSSLDVVGTKALAAVRGGEGILESLELTTAEGRSIVDLPGMNPYVKQLDYFLGAIERGIPADQVPTTAAILALRVALAAAESVVQGRRIELVHTRDAQSHR